MKNQITIAHISYLKNGKREKVSPNYAGRFKVPNVYVTGTPYDFIEQGSVRVGDPTLNLTDGDKIRVFQGGDPSQYTAVALGAIEKHMEIFNIDQRQEMDTEPPVSEWFDWTKY